MIPRELETLLVDVDDCGERVTVSLNQPQSRNALSASLIKDFHAVMDGLDASDKARVVVIRSAGGVFRAGGNIRESVWCTARRTTRRRSKPKCRGPSRKFSSAPPMRTGQLRTYFFGPQRCRQAICLSIPPPGLRSVCAAPKAGKA